VVGDVVVRSIFGARHAFNLPRAADGPVRIHRRLNGDSRIDAFDACADRTEVVSRRKAGGDCPPPPGIGIRAGAVNAGDRRSRTEQFTRAPVLETV
jgi:hypothetical protein